MLVKKTVNCLLRSMAKMWVSNFDSFEKDLKFKKRRKRLIQHSLQFLEIGI